MSYKKYDKGFIVMLVGLSILCEMITYVMEIWF